MRRRFSIFFLCCLLAGCGGMLKQRHDFPVRHCHQQPACAPGRGPIRQESIELVMGDDDFRIDYAGADQQGKLYSTAPHAVAGEWPLSDLSARHLRRTSTNPTKEPNRAGLWEWEVYGQ